LFVGKDGFEVGYEDEYEDGYEDGIEDDKMDEGVDGMLDALRRLRAASMRVNVSFEDDMIDQVFLVSCDNKI
tara:strand:+ start:2175 stop:2390 length:216 start_codon:yes stop_codon:yes gene_type:complete